MPAMIARVFEICGDGCKNPLLQTKKTYPDNAFASYAKDSIAIHSTLTMENYFESDRYGFNAGLRINRTRLFSTSRCRITFSMQYLT
jgi:hypothetical protein